MIRVHGPDGPREFPDCNGWIYEALGDGIVLNVKKGTEVMATFQPTAWYVVEDLQTDGDKS